MLIHEAELLQTAIDEILLLPRELLDLEIEIEDDFKCSLEMLYEGDSEVDLHYQDDLRKTEMLADLGCNDEVQVEIEIDEGYYLQGELQ